MKRQHIVILILVALGLTTVAVASLRRSPEVSLDRPPVPIRTAPVATESFAAPVVATGTLGAEAETPLGFKIGGVVSRILVDEGDNVAAGQLLAVVDQGEIDAAVTKAQAAASKAERDLARAKSLYRDSVISLDRMQDAATARDVAAADLKTADFNRRYAAIRAPSAGTIQRRLAEAGQTVAPGTPVLLLAVRGRSGVVRVGLADRDAARITSGDPAELRFGILPDRTFRGRVSRIAPVATAGAGTYEAEVQLEEKGPWADRGVVAGLVAEVTIRPARTSPVTSIPIAALTEADGDSAFVFVVDQAGGAAVRRTVHIAGMNGDRAVIRSGLDGARLVVTDGAAFLKDGATVAIER